MFRFVKVNKARCLKCDDVLISPQDEAGKEVVCSCGSLKISGGATALVRNGSQGSDFEELSTLVFDGECPAVNEEVQDPPPEQEALLNDLKKRLKK